ncbi:SNARE associated Golgi protein-like protein [Nitrosotalea sinensis]|uniref:SNARE associated Golgi protein-like protein n=1 Tax=Nitrosotalea sinensis TaxID=1499975 RepID=A0A2H1EH59_9ARCH|nr:DedA family protein [Candidatus Nitrosotalea sinensis]SHO46186.1 SNARE associated Golgi protein-like protein [Candidatus Nitrosotalea sinensis]
MVTLDIISNLANFVINTISGTGYLGIFFLMVAESALIPIPSEVIMPFSGYLVSTGKLNPIITILAGAVGNLVGSLIAYVIGVKLGREFIIKYGKYVLLKKSHLEWTESYFKKYGDRSTFVSRLLPAVRTYISLPAGVAKMNLKKFSAYTFVGSLAWSAMLTYVGMALGEQWTKIRHYSDYIDGAVIVGIIIIAIIIAKKKIGKPQSN